MGALDEPFVGTWAVAAGLVTRWALEHDFERIAPDVYVRRGHKMTATERAKAATHWTKGQGVLLGYSAAALHDCKWIDAHLPAEIALPQRYRPPSGIRAVQADIPAHERCYAGEYVVTTPARTALDLGRRLPRDQAIPILDALCQATKTTPQQILDCADEHQGQRGVKQVRAYVPLIDSGADSPPESHLRLLLLDDGLPRPTTQLPIRNEHGTRVALADMGWPEWRVALEYDGIHHFEDPHQRARDRDKANELQRLGWRLICVTADLLHRRPDQLLFWVQEALYANGAPIDYPYP